MQAHPLSDGSQSTVVHAHLLHRLPQPLPARWQSLGAFTDRLVRQLALRIGSRSPYYGGLVGLLSKRAVETRIALLIRQQALRGQPFAVLRLGMTLSAQGNGSRQRSLNEGLLRAAVARLLRLVPCKRAIAPLQENEFIILIDFTGAALTQLIEQILRSFRQPFQIADQTFHLGVNLGIADSRLQAEHAKDYVAHASTALKSAQQSGVGHWAYATQRPNPAATLPPLAADLRQAIAANQLAVHYQPIIDGRTLAVSGFEALLRWHHPVYGLVPPQEFIPLAEQSGLIVELGWWVMAEACAQLADWQRQLTDCESITISVNVSIQQFLAADCTQQIERILEQTQLPPQCLTLEITENAFMSPSKTLDTTLAWISQRQIGLSIDDFGTGYSSLSYLYRFPVSTIKIDRSFIQASSLNCKSGPIVEAIIALGHKLGLQIVAEGVESTEAVTWLQSHQCHQLQGFLFSRPLPAATAAALLKMDSLHLGQPPSGEQLSSGELTGSLNC
ncbi:MAG: bifunctional diguanylate cyclase/phosphodiesterase [Cyanobacteria bacterium P01_D01_bin.14]